MTRIISFLLLLIITAYSTADELKKNQEFLRDSKAYLESVSLAAHHLSFEGVFVVQHENKMLASKIVHCANGQEMTKINTLDGLPREIISDGEQVKSFFPAYHSIRLEQGQIRRLFPDLITSPVESYLTNYKLNYLGDDRVATRSCHVIEFIPKDNLRYPHVFCIDNETNLVLRASTLGENNEPLITSFFTEIKLDKNVSHAEVTPSYKDTKNWQVENIKLQSEGTNFNDINIGRLPDGFKKISEFSRESPHGSGTMIHQMYTDSLSSFSIFIEDAQPNSKTAHTIISKILQNSLSFYSAQVNNHVVTVVGDLPLNSIKEIVSSVTFSRSSNR
ncbi:MAG TPA: MucB/RseB C-terminal domain-containing protein [Ferrovaceae bacterium]|uniref:MucB/RseB C-terminal domain-containing protein n=1 Tax=Ferrovum sp. JA12 TaxID=1356299 RepID=UPI001364D1C8|nr:MucB/RseB C-terminal domain-containing protein [Ferrovum sp. JA12]HQT80895.1 MucB/RseB C-terminal domain-containing protein [Ferrovaceae bacterium]HQU06635.1 MucB/RseB C-terminal domain-containing protein [Ferrovaceae bacterium]